MYIAVLGGLLDFGLDKNMYTKGWRLQRNKIHEPNTTSNMCKPKYGHDFQNGMFAVSDWNKKCVFLIRRTGLIEWRTNVCPDSSPGSISSDSALNIYVCEYHRSHVTVFVINGDTLCTIYIGSVAPNLRSISISQDERTSIAK